MPKEYLLQMINERLIFALVLAAIVHGVGWLIYFKAASKLLNVVITRKYYLVTLLVLLPYSFIGKVIFASAYLLGTICLMVLLLTLVVRVKLLPSLWTSLIIIIGAAFGDIFIFLPLAGIGDGISRFLLHTIYGNLIASVTEMFVPGLLIWLVPKMKLLLIPLIKRKSINTWGILGCGALVVMLCDNIIHLYRDLQKSPVISVPFFLPIVSLTATVFCFSKFYMWKRRDHRRELAERERKIQALEAEQNQIAILQKTLDPSSADTAEAIQKLQDLVHTQYLQQIQAFEAMTDIKNILDAKQRNLKLIK
jgi:hypothetical protein